MTPAAEASRLLPALMERCRALQQQHGQPVVVPLSIYETDHDLATLRPEDRGVWSAAFHREVMEEIATRLRLAGFNVRLVPLDAAAYLRWLAAGKLTNTPANRAAFISLQTP
jgi:Tfp pilus assembly PilM family ATPase